MIDSVAIVTVNCRKHWRCGNTFSFTYDFFQKTKTQALKHGKKWARINEWKITRNNEWYCPYCAKIDGLRGTKKEG